MDERFMYDLTVVIATHNRVALVIEAVESVLKQEFKDFHFVLSDNSDNNDTLDLLKTRALLDKLRYIKRPNINVMEHFNTILDETKTKYMILFHDDDIMLPNMVGTLYKEIVNDDTIAAVGCNAYLKRGNKHYVESWRVKEDEMLSSKLDLIERYYHSCIVFFPSYIYNLDLIKKYNIGFTSKAGKYSDVVWLLEIMNCGKVKWLVKRLMIYRLHEEQDSAKIGILAQQQLVNYYTIILGKGRKSKIIKKYRISNLYLLMCKRLKENNRMTLFLFKQLVCIFKNQNHFIRKRLLKYGIYIVNIYFFRLFKIDLLSSFKKIRYKRMLNSIQ
jgi:glycosyltransferase involved in cell wall biosynthesis